MDDVLAHGQEHSLTGVPLGDGTACIHYQVGGSTKLFFPAFSLAVVFLFHTIMFCASDLSS